MGDVVGWTLSLPQREMDSSRLFAEVQRLADNHDAMVREYNRLREAARQLLGDHQAGRDIVPALNALEEVAGFRQQGDPPRPKMPDPTKRGR